MTITYTGDIETYPVLKVTGPGNLYQLSNYTTDQFIYFDVELGDGEEAILDLRPGKKTFTSNIRGDLFNKIRGGSDTESFCIAPGDNDVTIFIDDASAAAALIWETRFLGFEGVIA